MKKSFLKRAMAAAIAVPVALTQTVFAVAFAEDAQASTTLTVDTFMNVPTDGDYAKLVSDDGTTRVWEQNSLWNVAMYNAVNSLAGKTYEIDAKTLAEELPDGNGAVKLVKEILANNTTVNAVVDADAITITADVDYEYSADASDIIANKLEGLVDGAEIEINVDELKINGKLVIKIDTTDLATSTTVPASVTLEIDGAEKDVDGAIAYAEEKLATIKADVYAEIDKNVTKYQAELDEAKALIAEKQAEVADAEAKVAEKQAELDKVTAEGADTADAQAELDAAKADLVDAQAKLDDASAQADDAQKKLNAAEKIADETAEKIFSSYQAKLNKLKNWKKVNKSVSFSGTCDEIYAQAKEKFENSKYADKVLDFAADALDKDSVEIPGTVAELLDANATAKLLTKAIKMIADTTEGKINVDVTTDDLAAVADSIIEITVDASVAGGVGTGTASGTLTDEANVDELRTYFEEKEAANDYEIVDFSVVKVIDASATADANTFEGEATLNIKRVITYTVKEVEPTETDPTEDTDPTAPTEQDPTAPTEQDPTAPTEQDPTAPTEQDPTAPTEQDPTAPTEPPTNEPGLDVVVVSDGVNYFFSHDETPLAAEELVESAKLVVDENEYDVMSQISFGLDENGPIEGLTPAMIFEETGAAYVATALYVYYTPVGHEPELVEEADVAIFVGVKGDADLDSEVNAIDAAKVLVYAAARGAGEDVSLYSAEDAGLETLAYFLADVFGESRDCGKDGSDLNALDAAGILQFAAEKGANPGKSDATIWGEVMGSTEE